MSFFFFYKHIELPFSSHLRWDRIFSIIKSYTLYNSYLHLCNARRDGIMRVETGKALLYIVTNDLAVQVYYWISAHDSINDLSQRRSQWSAKCVWHTGVGPEQARSEID